MTFQPGSMSYVQSWGSSPNNVAYAHIDIRDPASTDINFPIGKRWDNKVLNTVWELTSFTSAAALTSAVWTQLSNAGGSGSFTSLTVTGTSTLGTTNITGNETITTGNVIINSAGQQLQVHGGAVTDFIGTGTLVAGTVTIANTNIAATDRIFPSRTAANASTTLGELSYTISAGASFTVTSLILGTPASTQTGDLSSFAYFIVRQV